MGKDSEPARLYAFSLQSIISGATACPCSFLMRLAAVHCEYLTGCLVIHRLLPRKDEESPKQVIRLVPLSSPYLRASRPRCAL